MTVTGIDFMRGDKPNPIDIKQQLRARIPFVDQRVACSDPEVDPEIFFPDKGESGHLAKAVCARCWKEDECREIALERNEQHGVWGGLSRTQRRRERRKRKDQERAQA